MTLLEIMIVLGVVGLMMLVGLPAIRSLVKTDLRKDANGVASAVRAAFEMASLSGVHHRVLLDLDEETYTIQACPEEMRLEAGDEETVVGADALESVPRPQVPEPTGGAIEVIEAESPEEAMSAAAALAGIKVGGARCVVPTTPNGDADARGNERKLNTGRGVHFGSVHVQHLRTAATTGKVSINAFPLGWSEKAVVEVEAEEGGGFAILVHGMTGRVEVRDDRVDPDRHMRRDAAGDEAVAR